MINCDDVIPIIPTNPFFCFKLAFKNQLHHTNFDSFAPKAPDKDLTFFAENAY